VAGHNNATKKKKKKKNTRTRAYTHTHTHACAYNTHLEHLSNKRKHRQTLAVIEHEI